MVKVGDQVRLSSGKGPDRDGVVVAVTGSMLRIRWPSSEESTMVPAAGTLTVLGPAVRPRRAAPKKAAGRKASPKKATAKKTAAAKKATTTRTATAKKTTAKKTATAKKGAAKKSTAAKRSSR